MVAADITIIILSWNNSNRYPGPIVLVRCKIRRKIHSSFQPSLFDSLKLIVQSRLEKEKKKKGKKENNKNVF